MNIQTLQADMIAAMKARDKATKESVSALIQAVKKAAIDEGCRDNIPESLVDRAILKEMKTVKEQIDTCPDERQDLKSEYEARYQVFSRYAPVLMSEDEIKAWIVEKHADLVESKNKGLIMKTVMPELTGKADGKTVGKVAGELCR